MKDGTGCGPFLRAKIPERRHMEQLKEQISMDDFSKSFEDMEEMRVFLDQLDGVSSWMREPIYSLEAGVIDELRESIFSESTLNDTRGKTGLFIKSESGIRLLGSTATNTLLARMKISGTGLRALSPCSRSEVYNHLLAVSKGDALLRVIGDKIVAAHAGSESNYSIIPQHQVFNSADQYLMRHYDACFMGASYDHYCTTARWEIQSEEVKDFYTSMMEKNEMPVKGDIHLFVTVLTSDVGWTGANIRYQIAAGGRRICLAKEIKCDHKNGNTIETFRKNLDFIASGYMNSIKQLERLAKIDLIHYNDAIYYAMKKARLGKVMINQVQKNILDVDRIAGGNALEAYLDICRVLDFCDSKSYKGRALAELEENIAACALVDWKECDKARPKD